MCDCVEDWATSSAKGILNLLEIRGLQEIRLVALVLLLNQLDSNLVLS